jgi:ComF family protein
MARAAALHEEPLRSAIHALKYEGVTELAPSLARYLVATLQSVEWAPIVAAVDTVIAVPLHMARRNQRGYNQSELLAEQLCNACGLPLETDWIERHRDTRPQVGLSASERRSNVADSFTGSPALAGKCILLVDDVYTTGATLWSCADAAKQAGAHTVYALTVARPRLSDDRPPV